MKLEIYYLDDNWMVVYKDGKLYWDNHTSDFEGWEHLLIEAGADVYVHRGELTMGVREMEWILQRGRPPEKFEDIDKIAKDFHGRRREIRDRIEELQTELVQLEEGSKV